MQGVSDDYADRAYYVVGVAAVCDDGVFAGGACVCFCREHCGGGGAVCAYGNDLGVYGMFFDFFDDGFSHFATLSVDNYYFHVVFLRCLVNFILLVKGKMCNVRYVIIMVS